MKKRKEVLAESLRYLAMMMCESPEKFSVKDGRTMDRALRSCDGIIDIDTVWVLWRHVGEKNGWLTE